MNQFRWFIYVLLTLPFIFSGHASAEPIPKADCHLHLVNFLQNGEFWSESKRQFIDPSTRAILPAGKRGARIVGILKRMDEAGVREAMISGMPFVKKWASTDAFRSTYYLDSESRVVTARDTDFTVALSIQDYLAAGGDTASKNRKRLYPFVCGFDATDMGAVDMVIKRIKEFPGLWEGIGEIMSRHDDLTNLTSDERPVANHPALHRMADFAGAANLPLTIHHNIAPVSSANAPRPVVYLPELIELFDAHPKTAIIWCHAGISRRVIVENLTGVLEGILAKPGRKDHIYIDLSWVVYENYIYGPGVDHRKDWCDLIAKFPSNFMIGSDAVADFKEYSKEINRYDALFEVLKAYPNGDAMVAQVARQNFVKLMESLRQKRGGLGCILPENYLYPEDNYVNPTKTYRLQDPRPK